jgi:uncharacterized SAM-binding protein YcdF (DUF218 family)
MESVSLPSTIVLQQGPRLFGRLLVMILLLATATGSIWLEREPLLRGAADLWIVSDPVAGHADAVAVLGGGLETRPLAAAELYERGVVSKILVSQVARGHLSKIGTIPGHSELNRNALRSLGVPDSAVEMFGRANASTRDEAYALREWADRHPTSVIVIPTEIFPTRRVRWIFDRAFNGDSARFQIVAIEPHGYTRATWWKSEVGLIAFQNEILKYLYYRFRY